MRVTNTQTTFHFYGVFSPMRRVRTFCPRAGHLRLWEREPPSQGAVVLASTEENLALKTGLKESFRAGKELPQKSWHRVGSA